MLCFSCSFFLFLFPIYTHTHIYFFFGCFAIRARTMNSTRRVLSAYANTLRFTWNSLPSNVKKYYVCSFLYCFSVFFSLSLLFFSFSRSLFLVSIQQNLGTPEVRKKNDERENKKKTHPNVSCKRCSSRTHTSAHNICIIVAVNQLSSTIRTEKKIAKIF